VILETNDAGRDDTAPKGGVANLYTLTDPLKVDAQAER
jgi:hypothetical protein